MIRIATTTVWCFLSWLEMVLVCSRSRDQEIPISRVLNKTVLQKPSHPQHAFSWWSFLRLQFFQHIVHHIVLDLFLFGWVELFSLFQGHLTFKHFFAPLSGRTGDKSILVSGFLECVFPSFYLKMNLQRCVHLGPRLAPFPEVHPCWNLQTCCCCVGCFRVCFREE